MAVVEHDGVRVVVRRRTIKDSLAMTVLTERFVLELDADASNYERDLNGYRERLLDLLSCTAEWSINGEPIALLSKDATPTEFDAAFERYLQLPEAYFVAWYSAAVKAQMPYTDAAHAPESTLSEEQRKNPN